MSTTFQGLQSPSKKTLSFPWPHKQTELAQNSKNSPIETMLETNRNCQESFACWNFMQSATNPCHKSIDELEKVYVHPLSKRSSSSLSTKSLEMCTESLGSETGSDTDLSIDELTSEKQSCNGIKQEKTREIIKKVNQSTSFPPPLTSISGSEGVQVQTHREGGRLVIKAFSFRSSRSYFQTERKNGRLRLSLMKDGGLRDENEGGEVEEENAGEAEICCGGGSDDEGEIKGCLRGESVKEEGGKIGCKVGGGCGGEWCSSSRCNGGSRKRLQNLQYWVAIS